MSPSKDRLPARRSPRLGVIAWSRCVVGLACALPLAAGCQTAAPWAEAQKKQPSGPSPLSFGKNAGASNATATASASSSKTDFHREVSPDQQYNVHLELGRVYEAQQQFEAALAEYQKSLDACAHRGLGGGVKGAGTRQAVAHRRMGGALDRMGRFAQAEVHYRSALKLSPDDPKVWNDAGYSYYMQSRWADAERSLKTAAKLDPNDSRIQTNLGLTLAAEGKTEEAMVALSKAGGQAIGHANLGYLLAAKGQTEQAKQHYQTALALQPQLVAARHALAKLESTTRRVEQVALIPTPPLPATGDANVRRTSGPRATPLSVNAPLVPR